MVQAIKGTRTEGGPRLLGIGVT